MRKIIIANWKMSPDSPGRAAALARKIEREISQLQISVLRNTEIIIAPPFPFLMPVGSALKRVKLGAQDVFWEVAGAYTGEVSWRELKNLKAEYVIIGHSERRVYLGETDEMVNKKLRGVLENGLSAILCIGERERAGGDIPSVVGVELESALAGIKKTFLKNLAVAYEPIWAISTNSGNHGPDTPDNAFRARIYIEKILTDLFGRAAARAVRVIYGGSVTAANTAAFMEEGKMDGVLVGGASLDPKRFGAIVRAAAAGDLNI